MSHPRVRFPLRLSWPLALIPLAAACGGDPGPSPSPARVAVVAVANEVFRFGLTTDDQVRAAERAMNKTGPSIPNGRIVAGTGVNSGWSWHLEDVEWADATIELCDGRPSDVEKEGPSYGGGRYCPWGAEVLGIQ